MFKSWREKNVDVYPEHYLKSSKALFFKLFSCYVVSDTLRPHGLQHTRFPCPSPSPGVCSNSCPLSLWCHPTVLDSFFTYGGISILQLTVQIKTHFKVWPWFLSICYFSKKHVSGIVDQINERDFSVSGYFATVSSKNSNF